MAVHAKISARHVNGEMAEENEMKASEIINENSKRVAKSS